jgi:hypothetical protein
MIHITSAWGKWEIQGECIGFSYFFFFKKKKKRKKEKNENIVTEKALDCELFIHWTTRHICTPFIIGRIDFDIHVYESRFGLFSVQ